MPPALRELIRQEADALWLSPISVWELGMQAARGRVEIEGDYEEWLQRARLHLPLREAPLNHQVACASLKVELPQRDPADRFLAATAHVFDLVLLTVDRQLLAATSVATVPY